MAGGTQGQQLHRALAAIDGALRPCRPHRGGAHRREAASPGRGAAVSRHRSLTGEAAMSAMGKISEDYRRMQEKLHENPNYGVASLQYAPIVAKIMQQSGITE